MKLKFTGSAEASATYQSKYEVTTGSVLEDVPDDDANLLLQTGLFEVLDTSSSKDESSKSKKTSEDTKDDSSSSKKDK